jgi:hypothetical protein
MGQAQARGLKAAELAYDNEYKRMDSMLKATVLDETKRHNMATEAAERAKTNVMAQAYSSHAGLYGAQAELAKAQAEALRTHPKGSLTEAQRANIQNQIRDDVRAVMQDPTRVLGLRKDPRFQGMSDAEIETALKNQLLQESGLLPATAINPIQNPAFSSTLPPGAVVRQIPPRYEKYMPYLRLPDGSYAQVPEGMSYDVALDKAKRAYPDLFGIKPTLGGQLAEIPGGLVSGFVGSFGQAARGIGALLPEETEKSFAEGTESIVNKLSPTAAPGYDDTVGRKLSEALGSVASFFSSVIVGMLCGIWAFISSPSNNWREHLSMLSWNTP